jgi:multiple sugar transport system ATP-binding protein
MNLVEARIAGDEVVFGDLRVPLAPERRPAGGAHDRVVLGLRPEAFEDAEFAARQLPRLEVEVEVLDELGSDTHVFFRVDAPRLSGELAEGSDEESTALLHEDRTLFNARVSPDTRARSGDRLQLAVDPMRLHFFDPATGDSLLDGAASGTREKAGAATS